MDVEILSRVQFAGTVMFHYLFPPLTIGLGLIMVILEGLWLRTRDVSWNHAARFWTRVFAPDLHAIGGGHWRGGTRASLAWNAWTRHGGGACRITAMAEVASVQGGRGLDAEAERSNGQRRT